MPSGMIMGLTKRLLDEPWIGIDGNICHHCFDDDGIIEFIKSNEEPVKCDYCKSEILKSCPASLLIEHIVKRIQTEYEDPTHSAPYDGTEGGYQVPTYDSEVILNEVELSDCPNDFIKQLIECLPTDLWCKVELYRATESEELVYNWDDFCRLVKYKCRYMFLEHEEREKESGSPDLMLVSEILSILANLLEREKLFNIIPKGSTLYRARYFDPKNPFDYSKLEEMCSPPPEKTKSSRISPQGISLFYASQEKETAIKKMNAKTGEKIALATFLLNEDLPIIDLTKIPMIPSLFGSDYKKIPSISFLKHFQKDFCKSIKKDGKEHIDYVPTQVVSEYCKYKVTTIDGKRIKGFIFPSVAFRGGNSCGLYISREDFGISESPTRISKKSIMRIEHSSLITT